MSVRTTERHNYTPEQVSECLARALGIVAELELEGPLEVKAFELAVNMLSSKQLVAEQISPLVPPMAIPQGRGH